MVVARTVDKMIFKESIIKKVLGITAHIPNDILEKSEPI